MTTAASAPCAARRRGLDAVAAEAERLLTMSRADRQWRRACGEEGADAITVGGGERDEEGDGATSMRPPPAPPPSPSRYDTGGATPSTGGGRADSAMAVPDLQPPRSPPLPLVVSHCAPVRRS